MTSQEVSTSGGSIRPTSAWGGLGKAQTRPWPSCCLWWFSWAVGKVACRASESGFAKQVELPLSKKPICWRLGSFWDIHFGVDLGTAIFQGLISKGTKTVKVHLKTNLWGTWAIVLEFAWFYFADNYFYELYCACMRPGLYFSAKPKASYMLTGSPSLSNLLRNLSFKWDFY